MMTFVPWPAPEEEETETQPNYHILSFPVISSVSINYLTTNSKSLGIPHNIIKSCVKHEEQQQLLLRLSLKLLLRRMPDIYFVSSSRGLIYQPERAPRCTRCGPTQLRLLRGRRRRPWGHGDKSRPAEKRNRRNAKKGGRIGAFPGAAWLTIPLN